MDKWTSVSIVGISFCLALIVGFLCYSYNAKQQTALQNGYEEIMVPGSIDILWQKAKP